MNTHRKITLIVANFYPDISSQLLKGVENELKKKKFKKMKTHTEFFLEEKISCYKIVNVPGIFEIPVAAAQEIEKSDGIIALGCVIKGKTPHFDFISKSATDGIMNLSIQHKKPIGNGILTCLNKKQAEERANIKKKNKGKDAALAIFSLLNI
jgi:6,7-dimethyl-8-ribityllumazine synthase